jgi:hypothetical protein
MRLVVLKLQLRRRLKADRGITRDWRTSFETQNALLL